jgi:hypothetical protein
VKGLERGEVTQREGCGMFVEQCYPDLISHDWKEEPCADAVEATPARVDLGRLG